MAESEEELKSLLMKVKGESEKVGLTITDTLVDKDALELLRTLETLSTNSNP